MSASSTPSVESLIPVLRYRDIAAAAGWLCSAFGFQQKSLVATEDGTAIYAELAHGRGTIMLVPVGQSELDAHMRQPDEIDGVETQTCYVTVNDADIHYHRAVDQGAEIILPLSSDRSGQRGYTCRDSEGHIWSFGTYAPAHHRLVEAEAMPSYLGRDALPAPAHVAPAYSSKRGLKIAAVAVPLTLAAIAGGLWFMPSNGLNQKGSDLWSNWSMAAAPEASHEDNSSNETGSAPAAAPTVAANNDPVKSNLFGAGGNRQSTDTIMKLRQEITETNMALNKARESASTFSRDLSAEYARRTTAEKQAAEQRAAREKAEAAQADAAQSLARIENELFKERSARGAAVQETEKVKAKLEAELAKQAKADTQPSAAPAAAAALTAVPTGPAPEPTPTPASTEPAPVVAPATNAAVQPETPAPAATAAVEPQSEPAPVPVDPPTTSSSLTTDSSSEETGSVEPTDEKPSLLKSATKKRGERTSKSTKKDNKEKAEKSEKAAKSSKSSKTASKNVAKAPTTTKSAAAKRKPGGAEKTWPYSEW